MLVVIDTLRADHVSCLGYDRSTTPSLCALAADGVLFERAYTPRTETTPAIASLLTGLYPHRNGLMRLYQVLPDRAETLAELLHGAGYRTGAFVSSFVMVNDFSGFAQGFDVYDDALTRKEAFRENFERDAGSTVRRALAWLRAHGPRAFLFVHLIEPHGPYTPASPWLERFALPPSAVAVPPKAVPPYQRIPGLRLRSEYVGRYDGEIATADQQVGRLLQALRTLGWYDSATVIVTADHGESLGEEGHWFRHGASVLDAEAHVPLAVKFPAGDADGPPPGTRVRTPVSLVDLFATVIARAGIVGRSGAPVAPSRDLWQVAARRGGDMPPPVSFVVRRRKDPQVAAHGADCTVRWTIPASAFDGHGVWRGPLPATDWPRRVSRREVFPVDAPTACAEELARRAGPLVEDLVSFRRDFPVAFRGGSFRPGFRSEFVFRRGDPVVALNDREREALRRLGYLR